MMMNQTLVDIKRKISLLRFLFMAICIVGVCATLILLFTVPELVFVILTCLLWGAIAISSRYFYHKIEVLKLEIQRISTVDEPYQHMVYPVQEPIKQVADQYPNQPIHDPQQPYQGYPPQPVYNAYPPPPGIYAVYPRAHGEFVVDNPPQTQPQPVTKI